MRWTLALLATLVLGWSTPCAAEFVLQWHSYAAFPGSPNPSEAPLGARYFGDYDGDAIVDLILQDASNAGVLQVRNLATGILVGTINLGVDIPGAGATSVSAIGLTGMTERILVSYMDASASRGLAVYAWQSTPVAVPQAPAPQTQPMQARPNPFTRRTAVTFDLATPGTSEVEVFDVGGRLVRKLDAGKLAAGSHELEWDGTDQDGRGLSAGTYFYRLKVDGAVVGAQKAVMLR